MSMFVTKANLNETGTWWDDFSGQEWSSWCDETDDSWWWEMWEDDGFWSSLWEWWGESDDPIWPQDFTSLPDDRLLGTIKFSNDWTKHLATLTDGYDWSKCYAVGGGWIIDFVGPASLKFQPARNQFPLEIHSTDHGGVKVPGDNRPPPHEDSKECPEVPAPKASALKD